MAPELGTRDESKVLVKREESWLSEFFLKLGYTGARLLRKPEAPRILCL